MMQQSSSRGHGGVGDAASCVALQRVRQFPHVEGQWPTFACLRLHDGEEEEDVLEAAMEVAQCITDTMKVKAVPCEDVHVSLSRTFTLQLGEIDSFVSQVRQAVASVPAFYAPLGFRGYVMLNDDGSRAFFCVGLNQRVPAIDLLLDRIDECLAAFAKPAFYEARDIHVSLASWVIPPAQRNGQPPQLPPNLLDAIQGILQTHLDELVIPGDTVTVHSGNKTFRLPLLLRSKIPA
ncbi:hypothetical protein PTSG_04705 [Salpingoeca rosetta]|uniref:U6 snRNA phosphodiesterase 1 n=1 Tax=Salpingoeca rosetta (strain ATCC 50818 / BSB-021) TaxID=946362 RepID=F2U9G9_SALR5|nr:uncharacterized protein PTSG_04705 [Salpingoeca rosetta]EGD72996.1 hypothetical protein PTSG_04705 [Salpingoeca rosetta]|eukprot:XP_004994027.1 hypothetical protein PTSG_04705 [Salpingoeca rosetta]